LCLFYKSNTYNESIRNKEKGEKMKLKGKFISMFIAFALVPVLITGILIFTISQSSSVNEAEANLVNQSKTAMTSIKESVSLIIKSGQDMSQMPIINSYLKSIETGKEDLTLKNGALDKFKSSIKTFEVYDDILLLDNNGTVLTSALGTLDGKNLSDLEYIVRMKASKKVEISKVKKSLGSGNPIFAAAIPILDSNNNIRGTLITTISLSSVSKILNTVQIGDTGYIFVVESDGTAIAHKDEKEILEKNLLKIDIGKTILEKKKGLDEYTYNGVKKLVAYDTDNDFGWTYIATIPLKELTKTANLILEVLVGIILLTIISGATLAIIISKGLSKPIIKVSEAMDKIAHGDFTVSVNSKGKDEIAHMSNNLNGTLSSIRVSISAVKETASEVGASADTLADTSSQMTLVANEVAQAIQEVARGASEQAGEIMDAVNLLNDFTEQLSIVENKLINVSDKTSDTQNRAEQGKEQIDSLINSIKEIKNSFESVVIKVEGLSGTVSKIGNITDVINGISEQTNLLALNAAIEAARAGEQGRGFAVVADEVRKLAEESKNSSEEILNLVKSIAIETKDVIDTTGNVKELIVQQETVANETVASFENIIYSVEEIAPLMEETNSSLKSAEASKLAVIEKIQNVSAVSEEVSASSEEISASSEEMLASCEEVERLASKVDEASEELRSKVEIFKVE
jgi:methyl-accepting chemotaxis protein